MDFGFARAVRGGGDAEDVNERAARVPHGAQDLGQGPAAVVFDDDAGARAEVGFDKRVGAPWIAGRDVHAGVMKPARERPVFDDELHFKAGQQDGVEHPDDQLVLADGEAPHEPRIIRPQPR